MGLANIFTAFPLFLLSALLVALPEDTLAGNPGIQKGVSANETENIALGKRMFLEGVLPSGKMMKALVQGDIKVSGEQVICGTCHRRSGMGSSEGPQVMPAITGNILFNPLRLPTSKPPLAPLQRPAYTDQTIKQAIRSGVDANGQYLDPLMPRYLLTDQELDILQSYLNTLSVSHSPGVDDKEVHFSTIVADSVAPEKRKAMLDVMRIFFEQKNSETRYESKRARNAPWHKAWIFKPYRKWVLHVWELKGEPDTWPSQLEAAYQAQPVFAVLNGIAPGSWQPIHGFCQKEKIPCLFPNTDLPVEAEEDFYTLYMSKGTALEGEVLMRHLREAALSETPLFQVYPKGDLRSEAAAKALRQKAEKVGIAIKELPLDTASSKALFWKSVLEQADDAVLVLWLSNSELADFWKQMGGRSIPKRIYLSTSLYKGDYADIPEAFRDSVYFVHPKEMPKRMRRLLARSTGWFLVRRIYSSKEQQIQANAYFTMKMAGGAMKHIRGYFYRDYFIERIEHLVDNATYTSVYPRVSLAPGQRFVSKGAFIAKVSPGPEGKLQAVTKWRTP